jgi:nucleoside-diphosphate-sugar epimerase
VCYLIGQAGPVVGDHRHISGLAKQRDFAITQEVLRSLGDSVKDVMKRILKAIESVREDGLQVNVSGLDEFDIGDFASEVDDASKLIAMNINSRTLTKQIYKKLAFKYLCDERQEIKNTIAREIDDWFLRELK